MKYFIFAMLFIGMSGSLAAQGFFIPNDAFAPSVEKLKPLDQEVEDQLSDFSQRRYKIIDGRVIALPNEPQISTEDTEDDDIQQQADNNVPLLEEKPQQNIEVKKQQNTPLLSSQDIQKKPNASIPLLEITQPAPQDFESSDVPSYKNRYAQYLKSLKQFQKTGTLPENNELQATLNKLSGYNEFILYDGEVQ
ncbi:MAG: hypothetical protein J6W11_01450 [Alphaproteobacteria bacterium]|nr:hypothetical protein [Alphaproteobacteria bacterium]